ncbi:hypothetical protein KQX54_019706 [Cotesia glomerata]|uniref:Uncharacterized protein n=1 Tax=Cotesia glomerata TaxID=32391 RepID=A0AAV7J341_COTGL|nr:hypothetical protein KQX54_019706 [Cotesia glomerata]
MRVFEKRKFRRKKEPTRGKFIVEKLCQRTFLSSEQNKPKRPGWEKGVPPKEFKRNERVYAKNKEEKYGRRWVGSTRSYSYEIATGKLESTSVAELVSHLLLFCSGILFIPELFPPRSPSSFPLFYSFL